ncbi:hypothetical protein ZIOFF_016342 [Zingiber officinale]|uniref:Uncharacterized protein n=2 Tax=Zingiber officinale TaxID=94328 RepID=A0A8J5HSL5_ZINOF|nr:hypothetical protein ZIOFF_016342 [Zingiber officinale]
MKRSDLDEIMIVDRPDDFRASLSGIVVWGQRRFLYEYEKHTGNLFDANFAAVLIYVAAMSLTCLACRNIGSPSPSFRSYSVSSSSSEDDGQCAALITCLARRVTVAATGTGNAISTSKVAPSPIVVSSQGVAGTPRLQRSRAMSRDQVRNWNF